jgi:hypothetical protein
MKEKNISIVLDHSTTLLRIVIPNSMDQDPGKTATLYTTLGETIDRIVLNSGENNINLKDFEESSIVVRVETQFQTIVRELNLKKVL